jgi:uncharacterized membrane protein (UPF0136 family)
MGRARREAHATVHNEEEADTMSITLVNLILAAVVLILGLWAYARKQSKAGLLVGTAFGLFAIAHLLTLVGMAATLNNLLIAIRVLGYVAAMVAVYRLGTQR